MIYEFRRPSRFCCKSGLGVRKTEVNSVITLIPDRQNLEHVDGAGEGNIYLLTSKSIVFQVKTFPKDGRFKFIACK